MFITSAGLLQRGGGRRIGLAGGVENIIVQKLTPGAARHSNGPVRGGDDVVAENVVAIVVPDVGMVRAVTDSQDNVVFDYAVVAFAILQAAI